MILLQDVLQQIDEAAKESIRTRFLNYVAQSATADEKEAVLVRQHFLNGLTVTLNCQARAEAVVTELFGPAREFTGDAPTSKP